MEVSLSAQKRRLRRDSCLPPPKRMETSPVRTPTRSSPHCRENLGENLEDAVLAALPAVAFGTPVSSAPANQYLASQLAIRYASHAAIGPRSSMEDRSFCKLDDSRLPHGFFAVFDGHGGEEAAEHCVEHIHDNFLASSMLPNMYYALQDSFLRTDASLLSWISDDKRAWRRGFDTGAAAAVAIVTATELTVAHTGDCRVILIKREGSREDFVDLTTDHVADAELRPDETTRLHRVGAKCEGGYVYVGDHNLPMTRAFGNIRLKVSCGQDWREESVTSQAVTALPTVSTFRRSHDDLALVVASDGLFGSVMSSSQVADLAREQLHRHAHSGDAEGRTARHLVEAAFGNHSAANVSVVVVSLEPVYHHVEEESSMHSQLSVATQVESPGHLQMQKKLRAPFAEAYLRPSKYSPPHLGLRARVTSEEPLF